eukprot:TRINITY_DN1998_c0_g1_i8.p1 TRINITY_DN1998_c0_g1~~TRINITY_DN1998_c0_g1_i8.p1  ORF type:complete len:545 (+),score=129.99 TRINITY_DN1998_c0_g1_i8:820-2454(+)
MEDISVYLPSQSAPNTPKKLPVFLGSQLVDDDDELVLNTPAAKLEEKEYPDAKKVRTTRSVKGDLEPLFEGLLHYRRRIKWRRAYFQLYQRHLVYHKKGDVSTPQIKLDLLNASVSSYGEYLLNSASHADINQVMARSTACVRAKSFTAKHANVHDVINAARHDDECVFVLTLSDFKILFLRADNEAMRSLWMKQIGLRCLDLLKTISPNYDESRRVKLSVEGLQYDADDHTTTYQMEVHVADGEMVWFLMKSHTEMQLMSNIALEILRRNDVDLSALPDFPEVNLDEVENGKLREKMNNHIVAISLFPAVTDDMEFLSFIGIGSRPSDPNRNNKTFKDNVYRPKMQVQRALELLNSGDIVLFRNPNMLSVGQRLLLQSEWDHVGLVVHHPILANGAQSLYVLEAVNTGVNLVPIRERLFAYDTEGLVAIRRLKWSPTLEKLSLLESFIDKVVGKPYSIRGILGVTTGNEAYFCSQLIAEAYQLLGILPADKHAGEYLPQSFSSGSPKLQMLDDAELEDEEFLLTFEKREIMNALRTSGKMGNG